MQLPAARHSGLDQQTGSEQPGAAGAALAVDGQGLVGCEQSVQLVADLSQPDLEVFIRSMIILDRQLVLPNPCCLAATPSWATPFSLEALRPTSA